MTHIPVLLDETIVALMPDGVAPARLVDGTVGAGGHSQALLEAGAGRLLGCDLDAQALRIARQVLGGHSERTNLFHGSYLQMADYARELGWPAVDAILLDLGLSSLQLDDPVRGFSFRYAARLDMRFDTTSDSSAQDLVNTLPAGELARLLFHYGEERHARRIARAIVAARPVCTTRELADLIAAALPAASRRASRIHPATRSFQALRIAVNAELVAIERVIPIAVDLLRAGGRLAIISFHSLEDRIVKKAFRELAENRIAPPGMASLGERRARIRLVNRKPIIPSQAEIQRNPRSRSAKLRIAEKL
ncbi:MAG: 16S rRNA (cytosine(1402)-N(4))-methyltransferase RsmH [Chloroflexi bacterium]|nr:16S rRNA (cytosine(1402)-N(4))-methyltransferase RsmH [Chloroflexota bacterium]MCY3582219.1 16S rRNA (cytosine(1402)-N(4))-methyltransferase RsmH [Chloroflexota bacterium]MCY3715041.1 16S rRNA (cytosine(1402)-N(4))-methyltransferase RsmH [Chloroflexota bacterium]MDE2650567.1 16S rRNA (cytosine(1402)-N(4))-methyltransferase RsmH [Chloroflexota bacterium]MXV93261.1 16S rRNA (cytosine(1402)-N(4))-methyltransferase RsmH [Chloroflexota bacterium]